MPAIVHFEIPADDVNRAKGFYTKLFGWEFKEVPQMNYWLISTGKGSTGGGMMKRQDPQQKIIDYIDVPDIDKYLKEIERLGGKVLAGKTAVPKMGYFAVCMDTEGNPFGLWKDDVNAK
ncbi:MAG: VOC family protein [Deltaproteobacteria bacterium]|nr:VOC family protein [Deltaproteobacteria bacterium]